MRDALAVAEKAPEALLAVRTKTAVLEQSLFKLSNTCCDKVALNHMALSAKFVTALGCLLTGSLTGFISILVLDRFTDLVKASDAHEGVSYTWTVYSLVGIGLLVGTGVNILIRFCIRL